MICVVYVDDTIIGALDITNINQETESLGITDRTKEHVFTLRNEGAFEFNKLTNSNSNSRNLD